MGLAFVYGFGSFANSTCEAIVGKGSVQHFLQRSINVPYSSSSNAFLGYGVELWVEPNLEDTQASASMQLLGNRKRAVVCIINDYLFTIVYGIQEHELN